MKKSADILRTTNFDNFSIALNKVENETEKGKIKSRLSFIYFVAVFTSLILLFA